MKVCALIVLGGIVAALAGGPAARGEEGLIKGFRVPNYDDEGVMTSQIFGEFAKINPDGNIEITELRLEFYSHEGEERKTDMTVTSPHCFFNRNRGMAVSDSEVRISRDEFVVTGKGFTFNNEKQELRILSDSKVVVMGAQKRMKAEEPKREE